MPTNHNHITRDIKPQGQCPACDLYWAKYPPKAERKPTNAKKKAAEGTAPEAH